jgi:hypothetical protein
MWVSAWPPYVAVHSISVHRISVRSISVRSISVSSISVRSISVRSISVRNILVRSISVRSISVHSISVHSISVHSISVRSISVHSISVHSISQTAFTNVVHYVSIFIIKQNFRTLGLISHSCHSACKCTLIFTAHLMKFVSESQIIKLADTWEHTDDLLQASLFHLYKEKKYII